MRNAAGAVLAWVLAGLVAAGPAPDDPAEGFVPLFDGKTLDGWHPEGAGRFAVRDGRIVGEGDAGWLRTDKAYRDFEFSASYRALKKGAEGALLFRAGAGSSPTPPRRPARGYQLQIVDGEPNLMLFGLDSPVRFDRKADALKAAGKPVGDWQTVRLKVAGSKATVTLNGVAVTESDGLAIPQGFLGLQGENGQFEWRDLKIKGTPAP